MQKFSGCNVQCFQMCLAEPNAADANWFVTQASRLWRFFFSKMAVSEHCTLVQFGQVLWVLLQTHERPLECSRTFASAVDILLMAWAWHGRVLRTRGP